MTAAKPIHAFSVGSRRILSCHIPDGNPNLYLGKNVCLSTAGGAQKHIRIEGVSTANDTEKHIYDFLYTGDSIEAHELHGATLISDISEQVDTTPVAPG